MSSETKNVLRGPNPHGNQNFFVNRDAIQTNVIFNDKREENVILDDIRKYDVKFVLKLIGFEDKLNAKIKCSPKIDINYINPEDGYIINHEIIDCYKEFYNEQSLRHFLSPNNEMYNIYKKYSNTYNYISEAYLDNFSKEAAEKLPKEYIEEIQKKNDYAFSSQKQSVQLYQPTINYHRDQQYYYFENCVLISQKVSNHLLSDIKNNDNIIHKIQKVKFMIANGKLFLIHNSNIYYGKINEKAMYIPEIMICCYNQDELAKLIYELKINQIHYILRQTRKKDNNIPDIGIYKNTNIKIVIIREKYIINNREKAPFFPQGEIQNNNKNNQQNQDKNFNGSHNMWNVLNGQNNGTPNFNAKVFGQNNLNNNNINNGGMNFRKEIENLINILIDMKKITKKLKVPLNKNSNYEKCYPINIQWSLKYLEHFELSNLFNDKIINQTLEDIINTSQDNFSNGELFLNAMTNQKFANIINFYSNNIKTSNFITNIPISPTPKSINNINFYSNFILISEHTKKSLTNNISNELYNYCYFGDTKIFFVYNGPQKFIIVVYYLDKHYNILPEIFYKFNEQKGLSNTLSLLLEKGYYKLIQYNLMFSNNNNSIDLASPIFDQNNKEIGYAYKYSPNINDYTPYVINYEFKTMVKLFFNYMKLNSKSNMHKSGKYYCLINSEYIKRYKDYYDYSILEKNLSQNKFVSQVQQNIDKNSDFIVDDKMMTLIIKSLSNEFNKRFIENSKFKVDTRNISEEPNKKKYNYNYYDGFELLDKELYTLLFKKNFNGIYRECYFVYTKNNKNEICIKMPHNLNTNTSSAIYIYGALNESHVFNAKYLLEYNSESNFLNNFKFSNETGGFDNYLK